jgi:hypothetical protein
MNSIFKLVLAVVAGIVIASMVIALVDSLNQMLYPSSIMHPTIHEQVELIRNAPLSERLLVLLGYIISSFFGGYTAGRIAPIKNKVLAALSVGFFLLLSAIVYFVLFPQPIWMMILSGICYMLFSFLGGKTAAAAAK